MNGSSKVNTVSIHTGTTISWPIRVFVSNNFQSLHLLKSHLMTWEYSAGNLFSLILSKTKTQNTLSSLSLSLIFLNTKAQNILSKTIIKLQKNVQHFKLSYIMNFTTSYEKIVHYIPTYNRHQNSCNWFLKVMALC